MTQPLSARVAAWAAEGQFDALAALEALADARLTARRGGDAGGGLPADRLLSEAAALVPDGSARSLADELGAVGAGRSGELLSLPPDVAAVARPALAAAAAARAVTWSQARLTQGEILAGFAAHCRDELADVDVLEDGAGQLQLRWRDECTRAELRWSALFAERLEGAPWLLLAPVDDALVERFLDDADLRGRVSVWDAASLTKLAAARTSVGVYFGWFLRDTYRVKVLPAQAFTAGLLARGIISLGM